MRKKSAIILILIIALIGTFGYVALNGMNVGRYTVDPLADSIKQGLDLRGGIYVVYEPDAKDMKDMDARLNGAMEVLRRRLDSQNYTEAVITRQGSNRIRVEIPDVDDPKAAKEYLGQTAILSFVDPDGNTVITGEDVKQAKASFGGQYNAPVVELELKKDGAIKFEEATGKYIEQVIEIRLDENVISAPKVESKISGGKAVITGMGNFEAASKLATLIQSGALPVPLKDVETSFVGATLGTDALSKSIKAGLIGVIIILIFMIVFYKIPGFVANLALTIYLLLVLLILAGTKAQLTLPGIAGLILSIGMAVDANVIIFERLKDELRTGKTLRSSVDSGFARAFRTILDANITTLIAAVVLYQFGTGPIQGFAVTLGIGIVVSMFTAVVITKFLLKQVINLNLTKDIKMYGVRGVIHENS